MKLKERLKRIISNCVRAKGSQHVKARNQFLRLALVAAKKKHDQGEIPSGLQNSLGGLIETLHETAGFLDAAAHVDEMVFESKNGVIHDIPTKTKQRYEAYQDRVRSEFDSGSISFRPYVYVLWKAKSPSQFLYIGKATDSSRLLGSDHVKLAASLPLCTNISIVFPHRSNDQNIANLEASLIRLVEFETGRLPVNNAKRERLDSHYASNSLESMSDYLFDLGDKLSPD
jgi:hypothetical protein